MSISPMEGACRCAQQADSPPERKPALIAVMGTSGMERNARSCALKDNTLILLPMSANAQLVSTGQELSVLGVVQEESSRVIPRLVSAQLEPVGTAFPAPRSKNVPMARNTISSPLPASALLELPGMELTATSSPSAKAGSISKMECVSVPPTLSSGTNTVKPQGALEGRSGMEPTVSVRLATISMEHSA